MSDTTNAASVWAVQSKLLEEVDKEYEWGDIISFTSILIDECNGSRLDEAEAWQMAEDNDADWVQINEGHDWTLEGIKEVSDD